MERERISRSNQIVNTIHVRLNRAAKLFNEGE